MKTTLTILAYLLIGFRSYSQQDIRYVIHNPVMDETSLILGRNTFKLVTSNDSIVVLINKQLSGRFYRMSANTMHSHTLITWEYSFTFRLENLEAVMKFINSNNYEKQKRN